MTWERVDDNPPGLIKRTFYTEDGVEYVREEWDLTVPGCPLIAIDNSKWGTGESAINLSVKGVTRIGRRVTPIGHISLKAAIASELYKVLERLEAPPDLLSIIGSWGDTISEEDVLRLLKDYNETGRVLHERQ